MRFDWNAVLFAGKWTQAEALAFARRVEEIYAAEHPS